MEDKALRLTHKFLAELKNIGLNQNEAEALVRRVIDEETPLSSEQ